MPLEARRFSTPLVGTGHPPDEQRCGSDPQKPRDQEIEELEDAIRLGNAAGADCRRNRDIDDEKDQQHDRANELAHRSAHVVAPRNTDAARPLSSNEEAIITAPMSVSATQPSTEPDVQPVVAASGTEAMPPRHVRALRLWLSFVALLIVAMILVGGATRLTDSGLSITEWQPIVGAIPPLSDAHWQEAFDAYKQIPEYSQVNQGMDLQGFKAIYWWEWAHRFLGRFIGLVFFVPFVAFWFAGYVPRPLLPRLLGLFVLGGLQGALGWYMVKSGLVDRVDVSQYRLAAHFGVAVLIFGYTLWLILNLGRGPRAAVAARTPALVAGLVLVLVYLQLLAGALVAGIDGGMGFNTWPLMNGAVIPAGLGAAEPWYLNIFENPLTVQFDHRVLGYTVVLAAVLQAVWLARNPDTDGLRPSATALAVLSLLQVALGIWTLLSFVPIELGLAHQAGAIAVFAAALYHFWRCVAGEAHEGRQTAASA